MWRKRDRCFLGTINPTFQRTSVSMTLGSQRCARRRRSSRDGTESTVSAITTIGSTAAAFCARSRAGLTVNLLEDRSLDFPFCLAWANENWTRVWDGGGQDMLLQQHYNAADDRAYIRTLIPAFADPRYVRINGRPLLLVYRTELLPEPARTAEVWRAETSKAGIGDLYLARVENFVSRVDPASIGFDAAVEFAPLGAQVGKVKFRGSIHRLLAKLRLLSSAYTDNRVSNYLALMLGMLAKPEPTFKRFRCVTPMWDNTARRQTGARVYIGSTPELYKAWLAEVARQTINKYLEATKAALDDADNSAPRTQVLLPTAGWSYPRIKRIYWRALAFLAEQRELLKNILGRQG